MSTENKMQWKFGIGPECSAIYVYGAPDIVTAENCEAWRVYLENLIGRTMTLETMETPEFQQALNLVLEKKEQEERWRLKEEQRKERERRCRAMQRPRLAFIPKGLTVDYEQEYAVFLQQEVVFVPVDLEDYRVQRKLILRWVNKSIPQILDMKRPDAAYAIAVNVCRHLPQFLQREDLKEYHDADKSRLRALIVEAFKALVKSVMAWNNEEKRQYVVDLIRTQAPMYSNYRGLPRLLQDLIPGTPFVGEAVATQREKNDDELRLEAEIKRQRNLEERRRVAVERESRSVIPLNQEIEQKVFTNYVVGIDGILLDDHFRKEFVRVDGLLDKGLQREAALYAMQLVKSLCRHFIADEHWNYFDDWYCPDASISDLMRRFEKIFMAGKLSGEVIVYMRSAWKEIQQEECYKDYGYPSYRFLL